MFKKHNFLLLFGLCIFIMLSVSSVCAVDTDSMHDDTYLNDNIVLSDNSNHQLLSDDNNQNDLNVDNGLNDESSLDNVSPSDDESFESFSDLYSDDEESFGSFSDLYSDISNMKDQSVLNITKDYRFMDTDYDYANGISIKKNSITINGNGHIIDASKKASIFTINGDSVKIFNLTFINAYHLYYDKNPVNEKKVDVGDFDDYQSGKIEKLNGYGAINWKGNNGSISECYFLDNTGLNGGALSWIGNKGTVSNCTFFNNVAYGAGGGVYILGNNCTIIDSDFTYSASILTNESIFIDKLANDYALFNVTTDSNVPYLDGNKTAVDVNYLTYSNFIEIANRKIDLISALYLSILWGGAVSVDDHFCYYYSYSNETHDFVFSFITELNNGFTYRKAFHFSNIYEINDIFKNLMNFNYKNELTFIKHLNVTNENDYAYACSYSRDSLYNEEAMADLIEEFWFNPPDIMVFALDINFPKPLTINSNLCFNTEKKRFDNININGNGSKIYINNNLKDEYKWACLRAGCVFSANDLIIQGFNTALDIRGGYALLDNVTLDGNKLKYVFGIDYGGAILNAGYCKCTNCTFTNNYAKNGGAIFNQGLLYLDNCTFANNKAYTRADDVLSADKAVVYLDGNKLEKTEGVVKLVDSLNAVERTAIEISSYVASFTVGFIVGFATANPALGMLVGGIAGGAIGAVASAVILTYTYDIYFNRFETAFFLITGSIEFGMLGGALGGSIRQSMIQSAEAKHVQTSQAQETVKTGNNNIETQTKKVIEVPDDNKVRYKGKYMTYDERDKAFIARNKKNYPGLTIYANYNEDGLIGIGKNGALYKYSKEAMILRQTKVNIKAAARGAQSLSIYQQIGLEAIPEA